MLAIVAGHLWTFAPWVRPWLFTWHVPLFFVLVGLFWSPTRTVLAEVRFRALTLLVPFVLWAVILIATGPRDLWSQQLDDFTRATWSTGSYQTPFWAFWFLPALFWGAVWFRIAGLLPLAMRAVALVGAAVVVAQVPAVGDHTPLLAAQGLICALWIFAGELLGRARQFWRADPNRRLLAAAGGLALLVVAAIFVDSSRGTDRVLALDLRASYLGSDPLVSVTLSLVVCASLVMVFDWVPDPALPAVIHDLARGSLVVMVVHVAVIDWISGLAAPSVRLLAVVAAASWGVALVLTSMNRTSWLTGAAPKQGPRSLDSSRAGRRDRTLR